MAFSLSMTIPVLSWIVALLGQSSTARETFIQIVVYQNTILLLCLIVWLVRRLKVYAERDPTLPLFHRFSTKPETEPIVILVTKSVTTKVEDMTPLPATETCVETAASSLSSQSRRDTFCH